MDNELKEEFLKHYSEIQLEKFTILADKFQKVLNYTYKDFNNLIHALFFPSTKLQSKFEQHEFLGDAVLNIIVSELLIEQKIAIEAGDLTRYKSSLTRNNQLAKLCTSFPYPELLEILNLPSFSKKQYADAYEALIGSIYTDMNYNKNEIKNLIKNMLLIDKRIKELQSLPWNLKDPKSFLNEFLQKKYKGTAKVLFQKNNKGTDDRPEFYIDLKIKDDKNNVIFQVESSGPYTNVKEGEMDLSEQLLIQLKDKKLL